MKNATKIMSNIHHIDYSALFVQVYFYSCYFIFYRMDNAVRETIIISKAEFKRLCDDSVQLQITRRKLEKLESMLNKEKDTPNDSETFSIPDVSIHQYSPENVCKLYNHS